ncbi:MAG: hypothetical protein LQ338_003778 [Usnochroma carphineum]|nr:MAG: hypothetical protein LQ338_003778 [Usnochroma carphineum]
MPGILPMKVIKLGTSAQSRIAQACDRCRSKKIRCDGITPCCTQCANVGFECKTSDKLSRRAFPRGYTESLEERVRSLEQEVRELKDLLDEKDEKIDILSRIHSGPPAFRTTSNEHSQSPPVPVEAKPNILHEDQEEDTFKVQQPPSLLDGEADSYFMGASSGRAFIDTFRSKVQGSGKLCTNFATDAFFTSCQAPTTSPKVSPDRSKETKAPPRLVSDQMINIFFQEWAPLFPVLHRPTFLDLYTEYVADPEGMKDQHAVAQLNLVFGIAALSAEGQILTSSQWIKHNIESFERQWREAIEAILPENTLATLQCLVLAQLYCISKADYNKLVHYKGMAMSLSHRLGLHQCQTRSSFGALTSETRKRVFWTLYTLDCFSAALLGIPKLLNEDDIHAEYPMDIDDENVSERGFLSTKPGEFTRLSSALALFRGSRILAKVLDEVYPALLSYDLSLQKLSALNDELDVWLRSLPVHLRLQFVQDKPSTNVVSSRSPFLSLTYHYIRSLIHRPAVGSGLGAKASSSVVSLANSSKHIIQIVQLLDERRMSFSFCLHKNELLLLSGFGLLYQGLGLNRRGKLMQDSQRLVCSVIAILEHNAALGSSEFKRVACAMSSVDGNSQPNQATQAGSIPGKKSDGKMKAPQTKARPGRKQLQVMAARFSTDNIKTLKEEGNGERTATAPAATAKPSPIASNSCQLIAPAATAQPVRPQQPEQHQNQQPPLTTSTLDVPNLDYLSFGDNSGPTTSLPNAGGGNATKGLDVDEFTGSLTDTPLPVLFDGFFNSSEALGPYVTSSSSPSHLDWGPDVWNVPADVASQPAAQSVLSFTESELTSCEEWSIHDGAGEYRGITLPNTDHFGHEALDVNFRA